MSQKINHLVVDSGAFIKNAPVHEYAENIYSVNGIVNEIRDKATRQRLQVLPYSLKLKDPESENIKYVTEFSKKTGDYSSLSAVDLRIIALTYQLLKEHVGTDHLNKEPSCEVTGKRPENEQPFYGFYNPELDEDETGNDEGFSENSITSMPKDELKHETELNDKTNTNNSNDCSDNVSLSDCEEFHDCEDSNNEISENVIQSSRDTEVNIAENCDNCNIVGKDSERNSDYENDDKTNVEDAWITPKNLAEVQKKMANLVLASDSEAAVACITTDFAIQNVLLQLGIRVVSVDGMLIKRAKVFILRCYACFKTTTDMTCKFCKNCGNQTLKRVSVSINEDGSKTIHINFRRPINIRGTKYSLPKPQGGKHAQNPHLCADQHFPQNRPSKAALKKIDVFSPDYNDAVDSPFSIHDVYSRAAMLGIHGHSRKQNRRNPNECHKRTGNRKNKK